MEILDLCKLLINTDQLLIKQITLENKTKIGLLLESTAKQARCPACHTLSSEIHSIYTRFPSDLAWADWLVVWHLQVKRFFCRNEDCPKRTFAERYPGILPPYARCTSRMQTKQSLVGINVCARTAEKILQVFKVGISDTTINRLIRSVPDPDSLPVRVLGVDDWAKRKGQKYGTILVDLERSQTIDLLGDRTADTLAEWLKKHPEIEIVSRDRSQTYAKGIAQGAPQAMQVADRWHLLKNLTDAVFKIVQKEYTSLKKLDRELKALEKKSENPHPRSSEDHQILTPSESQRQERIQQAIALTQLGWHQKDIADQLGIHPKTIRRYLHNPDPQSKRRRRPQILDPYKPYIRNRWKAGCRNTAQIFREIKAQGYPGQLTIVRDYINIIQKNKNLLEGKSKIDLPAPSILAWWVANCPTGDVDHVSDWKTVVSSHPKLEITINLAREFSRMVKEHQMEELGNWLTIASQSEEPVWRNFAEGLKQDHDAIQAALSERWSNGPTEGHINRLKCLKRQMYGRAKDDLLRKRALWQGRWSFT